ncbi:hypothetical protein K432DRAFT_308469 [Lepidopterella palustris CBS 459.81]|uniref:Uncharacterized protein n=1 Tax=Lepidopterella palustris CBS 459.81 TaxID=1314670 RepID=A0A8E2E139_9PEZI|nr:hypothetical protein K432DRAFT_308469 [Lepidopterella palustris CBS 459.81]
MDEASSTYTYELPTYRPLTSTPALYDRYIQYHKCFSISSQTLESHHARAINLATSLLTNYFPPSQGFSLRHEPFTAMAEKGWAIEGKFVKGVGLQMHYIPPELICGFWVDKSYEIDAVGLVDGVRRPHALLGIMTNDLSTAAEWEKRAPLQRGDLVTGTIGLEANGIIKQAHGILIFGPLIEFYTFNRKNKQETMPFKERTTPGRDHSFEMEAKWCGGVENVFKSLAGSSVEYVDGGTAVGSRFGEVEEEWI